MATHTASVLQGFTLLNIQVLRQVEMDFLLDEFDSYKSRKQKNIRKRHFCPFPQCESYLKLSQHIKDQHEEVGDEERREMCKKAPVAPDKWARKSVPRQKQIASFFSVQDAVAGQKEITSFFPGARCRGR